MAKMLMGKNDNEKNWHSVCDPCVGSGSLLIAAANLLREEQIDYRYDTLFVGMDIDRLVALMTYLQISIMGCPGYVIVGDSLAQSVNGTLLHPVSDYEIWYTPEFYNTLWQFRRMRELLEF